jgi:hypothetical protein
MSVTMATASEDVLVPLRGGPAVPASIIGWYIDSSFRGLTLRAEPDGSLYVGPCGAVTPADLAFCRTHKAALLACIRYCDAMASRPT